MASSAPGLTQQTAAIRASPGARVHLSLSFYFSLSLSLSLLAHLLQISTMALTMEGGADLMLHPYLPRPVVTILLYHESPRETGSPGRVDDQAEVKLGTVSRCVLTLPLPLSLILSHSQPQQLWERESEGEKRGRKTSLNHLLNFTLSPREPGSSGQLAWAEPSTGRRRRRNKTRSYNKEQFLQAK